jgi:TPR repeat protein
MLNLTRLIHPGSGSTSPPYQETLSRRDYAGALPHLRRSVADGDADAMAILGGLLAMGRGMDKDPVEACLWFRQAAVRNALAGQAALGVCLASGTGTPIDFDEAAYWLYRAGSRGHRGAVDVLAALAFHHHDLVGEHFSEEALIRLVLARKADAVMRRNGWCAGDGQ